MKVKLIKVKSNVEHLSFLYERLKIRVYSISHKRLPVFKDHKSFVENHPYRFWFLLKIEGKYSGSIYIQEDNSIGIDIDPDQYKKYLSVIIKTIKFKIKPLPELKSIRPKFFFVNVPINNEDLMLALEEIGCTASQKSYVLKN